MANKRRCQSCSGRGYFEFDYEFSLHVDREPCRACAGAGKVGPFNQHPEQKWDSWCEEGV